MDFPQPYFTACMYDDFEPENISDIFPTNHHHHQLLRGHHHPPPAAADKKAYFYPKRSSVDSGKQTGQSTIGGGGKKQQQQQPSQKLKSTAAKSCYKHVPHRDKPPHLVERRNARERRRVQAVNSAFARLRKSVPLENRNKRVSKVKTLQKAIEYIHYLQDILESDQNDARMAANRINKENTTTATSRWLCI